ncbi:MAG: hypothetical protein LBU18_01165 [Treponema sp.]|jgi:hypothetical protein|nr:hypothetical protein [Treponema sp.]
MNVFKMASARAALAARAAKAALAAFALACGLAACSYPSAPGAAQGADPAALFPDAAGLVRVSIPLQSGGGSDPVNSISRSVYAPGIKVEADFYEAIFRTIPPSGGTLPTIVKPYYRGTANKEDGYIAISVIPGYSYDVLLLAGSKAYNSYTLLATGYTPNKSITAGMDNVINIIMNKTALQWWTSETDTANNKLDTNNDFLIKTVDNTTGGADVGVSVGNRYVHLDPSAKAGTVSKINNTSVFSVQFNAGKLAELFKAERAPAVPVPTTGGSLTFDDLRVRIEAVEGSKAIRYFDTISLNAGRLSSGGSNSGNDLLLPYDTSAAKSFTPAATTADSGLSSLTITFFNTPDNSSTPANVLPNNDKEGDLLFELDYFAFGTKDSGGERWTIRNGLNTATDTKAKDAGTRTGDTDGGGIRVIFGAGDPDQRETVPLRVTKGLSL